MQLTVATEDGDCFPVDVNLDMEIADFLALCRQESAYLRQKYEFGDTLSIELNGKSYSSDENGKLSLRFIGTIPGSLLMIKLQKRLGARPKKTDDDNGILQATGSGGFNILGNFDFSTIDSPGKNSKKTAAQHRVLTPSVPLAFDSFADVEIKELFDRLVKDPHGLDYLRDRQPAAAEAVTKKDFAKFAKLVKQHFITHREKVEKRAQALQNPFSEEGQRYLMDEIQRKQIDDHLQLALEHSPESFGTVAMLYIQCKINGHEIAAFVDTGAQATIMSESLAQTCNIMHLIDKRFAGIAQGVGVTRIIGRIHLAQMQIGKEFLPISFTVLENHRIGMLLGLDMMLRFQCVIDLRRNRLILGTGTETEFLPESQIPDKEKEDRSHPGGQLGRYEDELLKDAIKHSLKSKHPASNSAPNMGPSTSGTDTVTHSDGAFVTPAAKSAKQTTSADNLSSSNAYEPLEADVLKLLELGFDREESRQALKETRGNVDAAAAILIGRAIAGPPATKKS